MKHQASLRQKIQYRFDNLMSGGIIPIIIILLLFSVLLTLLITLIVVLVGMNGENKFTLAFWHTFMHVIDQGTITSDDDRSSWSFRIIMLVPTVLGILIVATLVGLITSQIQNIISNLRRGHSLVLEEDHIVILGWSSKIFSVIAELIKANTNQDHSCIVILAERDKLEMEYEINQKVEKKGKTRIICRNGNPIDLDDLEIVNHHEAKSIIIISSDESKSDAQNIKGILAIVNHPQRRKKPYHIVAEIETDNNREIANIIGGEELTLTISNEVIARIAVQTCLQSGLSAVYNKLLDFDNVDIYFRLIDSFANRTFREILIAYEQIIPIGIQRLNGLIMLNPNADTKVRKGDKIILLAEDDDELPEPNFEAAIIQDEQVIHKVEQLHNESKKILLLGWNKQGFTIIRELDHYVEPGSVVTIMAENILEVQKELKELEEQNNLSMELIEGDITSRKTLNNFEIPDYSHVLILSYSERMPIQEADAHTLVTLMHLRDIKEKKKAKFTIVSEMLDVKNQTLAEVAQPDDFIISDQVISLIISQLAENKELKVVFDELFDSQGTEFYLKPISLYLNEVVPVNFYTIMESALKRNEIAIGYRLASLCNDNKKDYGIILNPRKSDFVAYSPDDKIIVLAEDL